MSADRYLIAALSDRIIYGSDVSFSRDDAIRLKACIPVALRVKSFSDYFSFSLSGNYKDGGREGVSPGVGRVQLPEETESFEFNSAGQKVLRAGQWKIRLVGNNLEIEQVMAGSIDDQRTALIIFRRAEPVRMDILVNKTFHLFAVGIGFSTWQRWKTVAA